MRNVETDDDKVVTPGLRDVQDIPTDCESLVIAELPIRVQNQAK